MSVIISQRYLGDDWVGAELRARDPRLPAAGALNGARPGAETPAAVVARVSRTTSATVHRHVRTVVHAYCSHHQTTGKKDSPYSITERRVPELIPVLASQPARDVSHKPGGRLPLLSARPAVTPATVKRAATDFAATEAQWV